MAPTKTTSKKSNATTPRTKAKDLADKENVTTTSATSPAAKTKAKGSPAATKKLTPKQQMAQSLAEMERMTELYEKEKAERKRLEDAHRAAAVSKINKAVDFDMDNSTVVIERPSGCDGRGFCLRDEMQLTDDLKLYQAIQRTIRQCVDKVELDPSVIMRDQDTCALAKIYKAAKERQPYLKRFKNDWASYEFVKMLLRNRRHHAAKRAAAEAAAAAAGDSDGSEDDDDDTSGSDA